MEWKQLLDQLTDRGDVAATLLGYAAGFGIDASFFPGGVPSGTSAGVFAAAGLGLKKGFDSWNEHYRAVKEARQAASKEASDAQHKKEKLARRAKSLEAALDRDRIPQLNLEELKCRLNFERDLFDLGLWDSEKFQEKLGNLLDDYEKLAKEARSKSFPREAGILGSGDTPGPPPATPDWLTGLDAPDPKSLDE